MFYYKRNLTAECTVKSISTVADFHPFSATSPPVHRIWKPCEFRFGLSSVTPSIRNFLFFAEIGMPST